MDTSVLRRINKNKIRTALRSCEMASKSSLSHMTRLSVGTCNNVLKDLLEEGEVFEIEHAQSTGGRRSRQFKYNDDFSYLMSLYVRKEDNNNSLYYQVFNLRGLIIEEKHMNVDFLTIKELEKVIDATVDNYPQVTVVSIGVPGVVQNGHIKHCDFELLSDMDLKNRFEEKYKIKIVIENDVNASAIGYYNKSDYDDESFVYIYYPINGLSGAGFIVHGQVLRGFSQFSGEVSHMPFKIEKTSHEEVFLEYVAKVLTSISCILNPKHIVLSGLSFSEMDIEVIDTKLNHMLPGLHVSELLYETDFHDSYVYGLKELAFEVYNKMI